MCPGCSKPADDCTCQRGETPQGDGNVRVCRETKGRKGKGVTVIRGLPLDRKRLTQLAKKLKQRCGAGGTVKDGCIEIQGEHRDAVVEALRQLGYTAKRSGA
jgi:translation initiation factor 1